MTLPRFAAPLLAAARVAVATLGIAAAAFCAGQVPATTATARHPVLPPDIPNPSLVNRPADALAYPAQPLPAPEVAPLLPGTAVPAPSLPVAPAPPPAGPDVALVLPLDSPDYQRAAEAVRDGFLAAAEAAGRKDRIAVLSHADGGVVAAIEQARARGARVIVGPLVRDDLRAVAALATPLPPTIALNQLDEGPPLPPWLYTLALAVESDARVLARRAREEGFGTVAIIGGSAPLMKRFASAFVAEWLQEGGSLPQTYAFEATPDGLAALRRDLGRSNAELALIAVDGPDAALARTFAPRLPAYTSALASREPGTAALRDLEDVRFVDVPWLVTPDQTAFAQVARRDYPSLALERLYALGIDAYRVAHQFVGGVPERIEFDGATGHVTLTPGHALNRVGKLAVVRGGQVVPLDGGN